MKFSMLDRLVNKKAFCYGTETLTLIDWSCKILEYRLVFRPRPTMLLWKPMANSHHTRDLSPVTQHGKVVFLGISQLKWTARSSVHATTTNPNEKTHQQRFSICESSFCQSHWRTSAFTNQVLQIFLNHKCLPRLHAITLINSHSNFSSLHHETQLF